MSDHPFLPLAILVFGIGIGALSGAIIATDHMRKEAVKNGKAEFKVNESGQVMWIWKPDPVRRKTIDLGVYDERTHTFTLPDGRVVPAPITNETQLDSTEAP